ncbi:MAG TPA: YceI family protein [Gemmatimonadales bacterium]|nr:YceI family protein [Gemmatimonadales bacterium]
MQGRRTLGLIVVLGSLAAGTVRAQESGFGTAPRDTGKAANGEGAAPAAPPFRVPQELAALDSVVYRLTPASRLEVKTGKAGLFGFAGHTHVIQARAFSGQVVFYPKTPPRSHVAIKVVTDSLVVLTPPDTEEIRKVTEAMRTQTLQVDRYPEITLASRNVTQTETGFHMVGALTMVGQTREVPVEVAVQLAPDSLRAQTTFSVKQTDFGIKPYSGGPGGTVKVADRVTFTIDAIAARAEHGAVAADPK